jgi:dolichol-phosphate mannosyltransferase
MEKRKLISIVCPVFNEQEAVPLFYQRLQAALKPLGARYDFELIFTNNRSTDRTLDVIRELRQNDPSIQVLTFSRNFGYQASVLAGLRHAEGDAMVVIDVDCEDPPEMIPHFVLEWEKGYDVVYGKREKRPEFVGIRLMRKLFYRLNRWMADSEIILDMAEFSLISAHVRDVIVDNQSTFPFLRTEVAYAGFERKGILYERERRICGKTHYNFVRMAQFAVGGILSSSTFLLRLAAYLAPLLLLGNAALLVLDLLDIWEKAFHVLVAADLMYLVFFTAAMCIYLARVYKDGVDRPVFIVDWQKSVVNGSPSLLGNESRARRTWTTHRAPNGAGRLPGPSEADVPAPPPAENARTSSAPR